MPRMWSTTAENTRLDVIALALDVQHFTEEAQDAWLCHNHDRLVEMLECAYRAAAKQQAILKAAAHHENDHA